MGIAFLYPAPAKTAPGRAAPFATNDVSETALSKARAVLRFSEALADAVIRFEQPQRATPRPDRGRAGHVDRHATPRGADGAGRRDPAQKSIETIDISMVRVRQARQVLRAAPELAKAVRDGGRTGPVCFVPLKNVYQSGLLRCAPFRGKPSGKRHLTKGQAAMALAMIYPEPAKTAPGRSGPETGPVVSKLRLSEARAVLRFSPELARQVITGPPRSDLCGPPAAQPLPERDHLAAVESKVLRQGGNIAGRDEGDRLRVIFTTSAVPAIGALGIVGRYRRLPTWWIPTRL